MTFEKALETLAYHSVDPSSVDPIDFQTACYMGAEAIRRIRTLRAEPHLSPAYLLPSETAS